MILTIEAITEQNALIAFAQEALETEASAIRHVAKRLNASFLTALDLLDHCEGKVITTGVGKSGLVARKLAATLTSTGCPAVFLHPSEAMHGDLGIVETDDCVVAFSNSGESEEVLAILPALLSRKVPIIAILGNLASTLAYRATVSLDASIEREICPLNLAPTTSVVVALAIGDALAMTLHKRRGFAAEDYARNHPGGRLGRRLLLSVRDALPLPLQPPPSVPPEAPLMEVLNEISAKCLGATCVVGAEGKMLGIITDYDTRQAFLKRGADALNLNASDIMNRTPKIVLAPEQRAYDALQLMEAGTRPISVAPVVDESGVCVAMLRLHDLVRAGL